MKQRLCRVASGVIYLGLVLSACLVAVSPLNAAEEFTAPEHWARIGTVQQWMDLDARFFRRMDDNRFMDRSQFRLEQAPLYAKTRQYRGELPAVSIDEYQQLSPEEKDRRRGLARDRLIYVERYLRRVQSQVQNVRENLSSAWGDQIADVTVVGDCLTRLGEAIGLDPSNPYAWHLQSYFALCAGDEVRSGQYLMGARQILDRLPSSALPEMRGRVALDQAWLQRNRGDFDRALVHLDQAENLLGRHIETHLLRGLIYAQTGRAGAAGEIAARLRSVNVRRFPTSQRSADFEPELTDPMSWAKKKSSYLADWIKALSLLHSGDREQALSTFGEYSLDDVYPLGWRFWNEAGLIYEMTGRNEMALAAWNAARMNRPYLRNIVYKPYDLALGILTGHEGKVPYILGYDRNFLSGSRLAFAASLVGRAGNSEEPANKQKWAMRALEELQICRDTGIYPGQAMVLRGHVYYLLGDNQSTLLELESAVPQLEKQGDSRVVQSVMKDMAAIRQNQQGSQMGSLLKQSGNSRGRWEPESDPEQRQAQLARKLQANPQDDQAILEMARFLIRHDRPEDGRDLLSTNEHLAGSIEGLTLTLEADRLLGNGDLAQRMVQKLEAGAADHWADSGLWSLVGSICHEHGQSAQAETAWRHALKLDPENQGLRMQLRMMGD